MHDILLVHLSDIHFHHRRSGTAYDLDVVLRNALAQDAAHMKERLGPARGILLTGDIAFSGKRTEYEKAREWVNRLCEIAECRIDDVWTTPGNHDVDRSAVAQSWALQKWHQEVRRCELSRRDEEIERFCLDTSVGPAAYDPIRSYLDDFAAYYGCEIGRDQPMWRYDLRLGDSHALRMVGLNSSLISDESDDEGDNKLALGSFQTGFTREDGVVYLVLCHHPPHWLWDREMVENRLNRDVRVQLYGHKHIYRAQQVRGPGSNSVLVGAGAVHPYRQESSWQPRYNLIGLDVCAKNDQHTLRATVYPRVWDETRGEFGADRGEDGGDCCEFLLELGSSVRLAGPREAGGSAVTEAESTARETNGPPTERPEKTDRRRPDPFRLLTYRVFSLPYSRRVAIGQALGLLEDDDRGARDADLVRRFLSRAKDKGLLSQLWNEVNESLGIDERDEGPFAG